MMIKLNDIKKAQETINSIVKKNRALIDDKFSKKFMTSRILQVYISLLRWI